MSNNTAGIFLKSNSDTNPDKYLIVYQRYYPGEKSYRNNKSFSDLLYNILVRLESIESSYSDKFRKILNKLNSSSLRNSGEDIDTDYTNVIVKPFLMMFQQNGIDINFICKSYGFSYVISIPKGSPEGSEGPKATAIREFEEEIGENISKKMEETKKIIKHDLQIGRKRNMVFEFESDKISESISNLRNLPTFSEKEVIDLFTQNIDLLMNIMKQISERIDKGHNRNNNFSSFTKKDFEIIYRGYFSISELKTKRDYLNPLMVKLIQIKEKSMAPRRFNTPFKRQTIRKAPEGSWRRNKSRGFLSETYGKDTFINQKLKTKKVKGNKKVKLNKKEKIKKVKVYKKDKTKKIKGIIKGKTKKGGTKKGK